MTSKVAQWLDKKLSNFVRKESREELKQLQTSLGQFFKTFSSGALHAIKGIRSCIKEALKRSDERIANKSSLRGVPELLVELKRFMSDLSLIFKNDKITNEDLAQDKAFSKLFDRQELFLNSLEKLKERMSEAVS